MKNKDGLKPCPFCGEYPSLPNGDGTQYEITCECGRAMSNVQIVDYMDIEERVNDYFVNCRYEQRYIDRAMAVAIYEWNIRTN